jgi:ABC-type multidrug transport system fused ATPase/permease subunit
MALHYQTEYRIGNRGRVSRSYTGFAAFTAIMFDLIFGLVFDLAISVVGMALRLVVLTLQMSAVVLSRSWSVLVTLIAAVVAILTLPFVALHHSVNQLRSRIESSRPDLHPAATAKPEWALHREV